MNIRMQFRFPTLPTAVLVFFIYLLFGIYVNPAWADLAAPVRNSSTTYAVRQGTAPQVLMPTAASCESEARARTSRPLANPIIAYQVKSGSGGLIATTATLLECQKLPVDRLNADGPRRPTAPAKSESNINSCVVSTKYTTATVPPVCVVTYNYSARYIPSATVSCRSPSTQPIPKTCPDGQLGAWAQMEKIGPAPECTVTYEPTQPRAGDCFTLDRSATLSWTPPTRNTDGSSLTNLAGYRVLYGNLPGELVRTIQLNAQTTRYVITDLDPATWYFSLKSFNTDAKESVQSNTTSKIIRSAPP